MAQHTAQQILSWCVPYIPREGAAHQYIHSSLLPAGLEATQWEKWDGEEAGTLGPAEGGGRVRNLGMEED